MLFHLDFTNKAQKDIFFHKKSGDKAILSKLYILLDEIAEHPFEGTGKPEQLKYKLSGVWSRRMNRKHRLVYKVKNDVVIILSAKGHY